jgi:predicted nuclease with TOPRIM domain
MWIRDIETPAGLDINDAAPAVRDASSREDVQLVRAALSNFLFPDDKGSFHDIIRDIALDEQEQGTGLEEPMTPVEPAPREAGRRLLPAPSHHLPQPPAPVVYDAVVVPETDSMALEELHALVRPIKIAIGEATSETDALQSDLRQLREASARLAEEYHRIGTGCRETEERSTMVAGAINDLERRLGPLEVLRELTNNANEKVAALNQLAEELMRHADASGAQNDRIDHVSKRVAALETRIVTLIEDRRLGRRRSDIEPSVSKAFAVTRASVAAAWRRMQMTTQPMRRREAVVGGLSVVALIAVVAMLVSGPAYIAVSARIDRQPALAASNFVQPVGTMPFSPVPALHATRTASTTPATQPAQNAQSTRVRVPPSATIVDVRSANGESQFVGALVVRSEPVGAAVFINQKLVGETPLQLRGLRAGSHAVRIERQGYERWTVAVLVPADKQALVQATLQPHR